MHDTPIMFTDSQNAFLLSKVNLVKIHTYNNPTNMGTKVLPISKFKLCLSLIHIDKG